MEWALVFILSYADPNAAQFDTSYNEHATVVSKHFSQAECENAGAAKMVNINWSEADGGRLDWVCSQNTSTYALQ